MLPKQKDKNLTAMYKSVKSCLLACLLQLVVLENKLRLPIGPRMRPFRDDPGFGPPVASFLFQSHLCHMLVPERFPHHIYASVPPPTKPSIPPSIHASTYLSSVYLLSD